MAKKSSNIFRRLTNQNKKEFKNNDPILDAISNTLSGNKISATLDDQSDEILREIYNAYNNFETENLKKKIESFRNIDLKKIDQTELQNLLKNIVQYNVAYTFTLPESAELYRARKWHYNNGDDTKVFTLPSELWCLKPEEVKWMGRLNGIGQPMLYASFDALTPIHEIRNARDESFAIIKYSVKTTEKLKLSMIAVENFASLADKVQSFYNLTEKGKKNWSIFNEFIANEFTKKVPSDKDYMYKSTIEIVKIFDVPNCDGFVYPSIERGSGYNVAIKPESLHKLDYIGLSYWINKDYDNEKVKFDSFRCWQKWSNSIKNEEIQYNPISRCEIIFSGLGNVSKNMTMYYKNR